MSTLSWATDFVSNYTTMQEFAEALMAHPAKQCLLGEIVAWGTNVPAHRDLESIIHRLGIDGMTQHLSSSIVRYVLTYLEEIFQCSTLMRATYLDVRCVDKDCVLYPGLTGEMTAIEYAVWQPIHAPRSGSFVLVAIDSLESDPSKINALSPTFADMIGIGVTSAGDRCILADMKDYFEDRFPTLRGLHEWYMRERYCLDGLTEEAFIGFRSGEMEPLTRVLRGSSSPA